MNRTNYKVTMTDGSVIYAAVNTVRGDEEPFIKLSHEIDIYDVICIQEVSYISDIYVNLWVN